MTTRDAVRGLGTKEELGMRDADVAWSQEKTIFYEPCGSALLPQSSFRIRR